ncbi:unnamed protein product [marine sediment metagenome]|uniref:Uncharacterized protein n=1 Tax=marine sediment metagenome TaxID=412755 RepID=X0SEI5_9ZZZZ
MSRTGCKFGFIAGLSVLSCWLVSSGCEKPPGPVVLDVGDIKPAADYSDLAAVLSEAVDKDGLVQPDALKELTGRLDKQLKLLAVTGPSATPELFPTPADRLAYWYNARAAWAVKLAALAEFPEEITPAELSQRPVPLDGRMMTLAGIDEEILTAGGWQALVAAPGVLSQRAQLSTKPFGAKGIRERIAERFEQFADDADRFVIDVRAKKVLVPPVVWRFAQDIIDNHNKTYGTVGATLTTALLSYVTGSAHRRLQNAIGYTPIAARRCGKLAVVKDE